jgi:hypothetical protein
VPDGTFIGGLTDGDNGIDGGLPPNPNRMVCAPRES